MEDDLSQRMTALYVDHYRELLRVAVLLVDDRVAAEEAVQQAFVRVYRSRTRLRDPERALAFLRRSLLARTRSALARPGLVRRLVSGGGARNGLAEEVAASGDRGADRVLLARKLARLPGPHREAVVLRCHAELTGRQVSELMGVSVGAVETYRSRGLDALSATTWPGHSDATG